jgi:hypothetical protein
MSSYNKLQDRWWNDMASDILKIKRKADDGNKIISVRIREDVLSELDRIAAETNRSRNELINMILAHGVKNLEIE